MYIQGDTTNVFSIFTFNWLSVKTCMIFPLHWWSFQVTCGGPSNGILNFSPFPSSCGSTLHQFRLGEFSSPKLWKLRQSNWVFRLLPLCRTALELVVLVIPGVLVRLLPHSSTIRFFLWFCFISFFPIQRHVHPDSHVALSELRRSLCRGGKSDFESKTRLVLQRKDFSLWLWGSVLSVSMSFYFVFSGGSSAKVKGLLHEGVFWRISWISL